MIPETRWQLHAWVLMTNHYHLLLETPDANLARGMRQLNGTYSQAFNRRHDRVGHLFQGRYKSILVERESHLLELVRYVVLNPVRAGMVRSPAEYRWSSYEETAGLRRAATWLKVDWTLGQFGQRREAARLRFRAFVSEGRSAAYRPWDELRGQLALGGDQFVEAMVDRAREGTLSAEIPRPQRLLVRRPSLEIVERHVMQAFGATEQDMVARSPHPARQAFGLLARRVADARMSEIGESLQLSPRSMSVFVSRSEVLERRDPSFRRRVRELQERLLLLGSEPMRHVET